MQVLERYLWRSGKRHLLIEKWAWHCQLKQIEGNGKVLEMKDPATKKAKGK